MKFEAGDRVEVCSKQKGYAGSYYEATVVEPLDQGQSYSVRYKYSLEEKTSLMEIVSADEVRPPPPPAPGISSEISGVLKYKAVDAFDGVGWWVGQITGKPCWNHYDVYLMTSGHQVSVHAAQLRPHLDWDHNTCEWDSRVYR
ncbi:protein AGENET DOMAIN (AGD)-CONTAINING P1-like [Mercurialis annua]|uniref:protein AGENET DOMAIN (AGD)-CONTAINING P1-like n=1 Tax=Mercurialis annua TaxID=3986 RepID=UPI00215DF0D6|nr:protein AGENET DOMAIN (AGD)-CONTAINING P1-like [Mercurialis annua]